VGMVDRLVTPPPGAGLVDGTRIVVLGADPDTLSGSRWAWRQGHRAGAPPALDLDAHRAVCDLVRDLVADGLLLGVHDTADGGLGVALAEMAASSGVGATVRVPDGADHRWLLGETPGRFVLSVDPAAVGEVHRRHVAADVPAALVGDAGGDRLVIEGLAGGANVDVPVSDVVAAWRGRLPDLLGHGTTQG
jgi:phosphoribosylformylglycinamidine synthase subunit PurL